MEVFDAKCIRVIYHRDSEFRVQEIMAHLFESFMNEFGRAMSIAVLGNEEEYTNKLNEFKLENEYGQKCDNEPVLHSRNKYVKTFDTPRSYVDESKCLRRIYLTIYVNMVL